jgi:hypothetical protein
MPFTDDTNPALVKARLVRRSSERCEGSADDSSVGPRVSVQSDISGCRISVGSTEGIGIAELRVAVHLGTRPRDRGSVHE